MMTIFLPLFVKIIRKRSAYKSKIKGTFLELDYYLCTELICQYLTNHIGCYMMTFTDPLRKFREKKPISQKRLAAALDIDTSYVYWKRR